MTQVILNRPHTHAGRLHAPGAVLEVEPNTADWLIGQGVAHAEPVPAPERASVESAVEPEPKTKSRSATSQRQEPQA